MRNIAQNKIGAERESQAKEILYKVWMSKTPPGVGLNLELMVILLKNLETAICERSECSMLQNLAIDLREAK